MVLAALGVFIVPSTRCPVSLAASAMRTVSVSRSSPTTMTSGSSRSDALSAVANDSVCVPTSRWLIIAFLRGCRNSTGSSTVMTWCVVSRLTMSTIAASVFVLPWPVGPGDDDEALVVVRRPLDLRRQAERRERRHARRR